MSDSPLNENPNSSGSRLTTLITSGLLDLYSPTNSTIEIQLPVSRDGKIVQEKVPFSILSDAVDYNRLIESSQAWVSDTLDMGGRGILPPALQEYFAPDAKMLAEVFVLADLAVQPEWKDRLAWLILARKASPVFRTIYRLVTAAAVKTDFEIDRKVIDDEKKGSKTRRTSPE